MHCTVVQYSCNLVTCSKQSRHLLPCSLVSHNYITLHYYHCLIGNHNEAAALYTTGMCISGVTYICCKSDQLVKSCIVECILTEEELRDSVQEGMAWCHMTCYVGVFINTVCLHNLHILFNTHTHKFIGPLYYIHTYTPELPPVCLSDASVSHIDRIGSLLPR